jgi:hypothetical protein
VLDIKLQREELEQTKENGELVLCSVYKENGLEEDKS